MAIKTDTVTINGTQYKHTYSTTGHMITRNDNKQFVEAYDPTTSSYTYTESTLLALQSLGARLSALETSHNTLQQEHDALEALPHIIETGTSKDGLSWYKLYSDKCCIEGGKITRANRENIVTLPKPYADNTYTVLLQPWHTALNTDGRPVLCYETKKTDVSFDINMYSGLGGAYWTTIGYVN